MKCFVMCGGASSRMWPLSVFTDKSLLPLPNGKPVIREVVERLVSSATSIAPTDIYLCGLKKFEPMFRHEFRDLHVNFHMLADPVGTLGHLYQALKNQSVSVGRFMVHYADMVTNINYDEMISSFNVSSASASGTIAVTMANNPYSEAQLKVMAGTSLRVEKFAEKSVLPHPIWTGVGIFEKDVYWLVEELSNRIKNADIGRDLLPELARLRMLEAYAHSGEFIDVGTLPAYKKLLETV